MGGHTVRRVMVNATTGSPQSMASFIWSISDILRGTYKPIEYKRVILPLTILRRMDCVMQPKSGTPRTSKKPRYRNTSGMSFQALLDDPANMRENLHHFIGGFSTEMADVFTKYHFDAEIERLSGAGLLGEVVKRFAALDLDPSVVSNTAMGDLFEALIRAANTDSPGEDFTPRDAVHLLVDLLLAEAADDIRNSNVVRTVYDPTAGTGGLLTVTEERIRELNPNARLRLYGQEINDESYAICKSDVGSRGGEVGNIQQGNTLTDDKHAGKRFHFVVSNPPYGVDWKSVRAEVEEEAAKGDRGRFPAGLPRVSDGQIDCTQSTGSIEQVAA
jgi:type I restriction enzyme M protein